MRLLFRLLAFYIPLATFGFLLSGPHGAGVSALAILLVVLPLVLDIFAPAERAPPQAGVPAWVWEAVLAALTGLHLAVVVALPFYVAEAGFSVGSVVATFLVGNSGAQGIVLAHELVHRRRPLHRLAGRLLLATVLYEHFFTEHIRGHHRRVATAEDPATARFGERYWSFFFRSVPAQFRSAWALECKRLGAEGLIDRRHLHNRVLHGLVVGWSLLAIVGLGFGPLALVAHGVQALFAVVMLEAVNFIEHWGLVRAGKRVAVVDSWDSEGSMTYYMLIGLARHGDHHANAARPWQDLRHFEQTPKMPWGYLATAYCAVFADRILIPQLESELRRRQLGPYRIAG